MIGFLFTDLIDSVH